MPKLAAERGLGMSDEVIHPIVSTTKKAVLECTRVYQGVPGCTRMYQGVRFCYRINTVCKGTEHINFVTDTGQYKLL